MKKFVLGFFVCWLSVASNQVWASYEENFSTGGDWLKRLSTKEKYISLLPPTLLFNEFDIHLRHSLPEYIVLIDNILLRNPQLEIEDVGNIFASTVYLFEPQNREALKKLEMDFLRGEMENKPYLPPRLTIDEVLAEITP